MVFVKQKIKVKIKSESSHRAFFWGKQNPPGAPPTPQLAHIQGLTQVKSPSNKESQNQRGAGNLCRNAKEEGGQQEEDLRPSSRYNKQLRVVRSLHRIIES